MLLGLTSDELFDLSFVSIICRPAWNTSPI